AFIDQQHLEPEHFGQALGQHAAGKPGADDQKIEHHLPCGASCPDLSFGSRRSRQSAAAVASSHSRCTSRAAITFSMSASIRSHVLCHELPARKRSTRSSQLASVPRSARSHAATKLGASPAISTKPSSPYGRTTSLIGVETTGLPAARYSGVFVGLMKRVASFWANRSRATSHPAT